MEDQDVLTLLQKIDAKYAPTGEELKTLEEIQSIRWGYLSRLPKSIYLLKNLISLDLRDSWVEDIEPLQSLGRLQRLDLSRTKVSLIESLSKLSRLVRLDLSITSVSNVSKLQSLESLEELDLSATKVKDISALSELRCLKKLNISHTKISDISPLAAIKSLKELRLSYTNISDISVLHGLTQLQQLYLAKTKLTDLPAFVGDFEKLKILDLRKLKINSLPGSLLDLELDYLSEGFEEFDAVPGIYIKELELEKQAMDIFEKPREEIVQYYRSLRSSQRLYKYTSLERIKSCLENGVYAARLDQVNDPFEGRGIDEKNLNNFRICCMTNSPRQKLMWAYYGNHKGCCIEYDISEIDPNLLRKVDYVNGERDHSSMSNDEIYNSLYLKSNEWEHENEYRAVWSREKNISDVWKNDDEKVFLKANVKSITFGLLSGDDDNIKEYHAALELLIEKLKNNSIEIKKCCMRPGKSGLFYDPNFDLEKEFDTVGKSRAKIDVK